MPQIENDKILGLILRSTIGVVSRRTSESYANIMIGNTLKELTTKYSFFRYIEIQEKKYSEIFDVVNIDPEINGVDLKEIGKATKDFIGNIAKSMGKDAGYYFIKEIKQDLPYDYEKTIKELGLDLDLIQLEFITEIRQSFRQKITNSDILRHIFLTLFEILDRDYGRNTAFLKIDRLNTRLRTEYPILRYVKLHDQRSIQGIDLVTIDSEINKVDPSEVGALIQKIIQDLNNAFGVKHGSSLIEKLKNLINTDYSFKLGEIGVNLDIIQLSKELVIKHVIKALVNLLSESSTQSYAMLMVVNVIKKFEGNFEFLKLIKIDSMRFSEGLEAINVLPGIESVRPSELGRGIQKIIEDIVISLGEDAAKEFIDRFKERLGKAYILRIEEMGANLHMIELKQNLAW